MARKREGTIKESVDQLKELALDDRSGKRERIIDMLLLLHEDRDCTNEYLAEALDCSLRTIGRLWSDYQEKGIESMLRRSPAASLPQTTRPSRTPAIDPHVFDAGLVEFLNDLPVCTITAEWIGAFQRGLRRLFKDIDRVTVNVNIYHDLQDPQYRPSKFMVVEHVNAGGKKTVSTRKREIKPGEHLLKEARKVGFPFHDYHPPHVFDFQMPGGVATIGTIILWRDIWRPGISERTLTAFEQIRPFIAFLLSDCVARRQRESHDVRFFTEVINQVAEKDGLTKREQEVLLNHLLGSEYRKIASEMSITIDTVRKHVSSIHTKTGTRSIAELFARYLSPLSQL